jgi:hypothetical protein
MVLTETSEDTAEGLGLDGGVNRSWGQRGVQAEQVSSKPATWGVAMEVPEMELVPPLFQVEVMLEPIAQVRWLSKLPRSLRTRSPDVDNRTEVGVGGLGVSDGGGTNGDGSVNTSGGGVDGSIGVVVTSGDDGGDTGVDEVDDGVIDGCGSTTSQTQRGNSGTAAVVAGNPVNSRDDIGVGTDASVAENLDSNNPSVLGNTAVLISASREKKSQSYALGARDSSSGAVGSVTAPVLTLESDQLIVERPSMGDHSRDSHLLHDPSTWVRNVPLAYKNSLVPLSRYVSGNVSSRR